MEGTFRNQGKLPTRPIPDLEQTCNKLLEWTRPLLTQLEFENTERIVSTFLSVEGEGPILQEALKRWADQEKIHNWSEPLWHDIYLDARAPLPVNSNVFYLLKDKAEMKLFTQVEAAAALVLCVLDFKTRIDNEALAVEVQSGQSLCMNQYRNLFSATRIPESKRDVFVQYNDSRHIIVLSKGAVYSLNILKEDKSPYGFDAVKKALSKILSLPPVGPEDEFSILTTLDRESWADTRAHLLELDIKNQDFLKTIDSAIFALCLDEVELDTLEACSAQYLHGYGRNRWFDKSLQFIVSKNCKMGLNLEHTGFDGSVVTSMTKFIFDQVDKFASNSKGEDDLHTLLNVHPVTLKLDDAVKQTIVRRKEEMIAFAANSAIKVMKFEAFGNDRIKSFGISPDAFVQLAFHLAQYKLFGRCYSSYEAVMVRKYLHGRIEVSHCISDESMAFVKRMLDGHCDDKMKADALRLAAQKQVSRLAECREGQGIDSHLFALKKMYTLYGEALNMDVLPALFEDKGYKMMTHSTICTSTTSTYGVDLVGYGPVVEDGFAIRYLKGEHAFTFNMVSRSALESDLNKLAAYIGQSLEEMSALMTRIGS